MSERLLVMGEDGRMQWCPVEDVARAMRFFESFTATPNREPAPPVAERGETRDRPKTDPIALARRMLRSIEDNPTAGFRCEVLKEHAILLCRTVLSADKALEDLRERCAKACDARADAIALGAKRAGNRGSFSSLGEYIAEERVAAGSFREQTVRDCAEAIRALPLTPDAPSKP